MDADAGTAQGADVGRPAGKETESQAEVGGPRGAEGERSALGRTVIATRRGAAGQRTGAADLTHWIGIDPTHVLAWTQAGHSPVTDPGDPGSRESPARSMAAGHAPSRVRWAGHLP